MLPLYVPSAGLPKATCHRRMRCFGAFFGVASAMVFLLFIVLIIREENDLKNKGSFIMMTMISPSMPVWQFICQHLSIAKLGSQISNQRRWLHKQ